MSEQDRATEGIEVLPANLLDATRELEHDGVLRAALGNTRDGDYLDYYVNVKRREWQAAHEQITQWELDRYLQLFWGHDTRPSRSYPSRRGPCSRSPARTSEPTVCDSIASRWVASAMNAFAVVSASPSA
jgi:hypothetical protein